MQDKEKKKIQIHHDALVHYALMLSNDLAYLSPEDAESLIEDLDMLEDIIDEYRENHRWLAED